MELAILSTFCLVFASIMLVVALCFMIHEFIYFRRRLNLFNVCCLILISGKAVHLYFEYKIATLSNTDTKLLEIYWKAGCCVISTFCHTPYIIFLYYRTACIFTLAPPWKREVVRYLTVAVIFSYNVTTLIAFLPIRFELYQLVYGMAICVTCLIVVILDMYYLMSFRLVLEMFAQNHRSIDIKSVASQHATMQNTVVKKEPTVFNRKMILIAKYGCFLLTCSFLGLIVYVVRIALNNRLFDILVDVTLMGNCVGVFAMKIHIDLLKR
ncbi:hypothetical protein BC833DRAFT_104584 [Globomyces pollinis-pini]|nr:hypothetical protein BC833DRAFT_104584 [Globomyces pollinis-pini]